MKTFKSMLALCLALGVSGSVLAVDNANPFVIVKDGAKIMAKEKVGATKNTVNEQLSGGQKAVKNSAADKVNGVKEKTKSTKNQLSESAKERMETAKNSVTSTKDKAASMKPTVKNALNSSSKVNINTADAKTLQSLTGIGEVKAKAIVDYRKKVGKIKNASELSNIDGIGDATIEKITPYLNF
ncbi:ComEA family DNA-binding protein [Basfia succiniciproducens]|uniref:Competence protein ComEA n=1 Tax=Basfia succiniciproducens TaxID=653940 RepID=A0A1G5C2G4_9PAST|nr:helix-hairpin-helix domain-containing protein [Basfia succiniciproducens]QIM68240.1 hypothetical protein A4G13_01890 [Basfia succiniciproducens]SCX96571.1 competence protein ComEA [Basfia succiniciproducens]